MSTVLLVALAAIGLILWGVFKLLKSIFKKTKKNVRRKKFDRTQAKIKREVKEFEASIAKTTIVQRRKVFDSNRKYHYETTFMIYFKNDTKAALTVLDGSYHYDVLLSKVNN